MIITTSQERDMVDCCGCEMPTCDEPRKECESVSISACGYELPSHEDMPPEDSCLIFRKRTASEDNSFTVSETEEDPPYSYERNYSQNDFRIFKKAMNSSGSCASSLFSGGYSKDDTEFAVSDGITTLDTHYSASTTSGPSGVYSGTQSFTDGLDASNNFTGPISTEAVTQDFPDNDWTYFSPGVFTQTTTSPGASTVRSIVFSEPVDAAMLSADLDQKIEYLEGVWPDDECSSQLQYEDVFNENDPPELICTRLTGATKARYRFGIPIGYTRSTWEMQWDEYFFPDGWDATIDDPGVTPPDPLPEEWAHPQIPDPDATPPSLVAAKSWTWSGDTGAPWSDWFEIPIPAEPGETRPVNVLVKCYKSTRIGVVPTAHGETYVAP